MLYTYTKSLVLKLPRYHNPITRKLRNTTPRRIIHIMTPQLKLPLEHPIPKLNPPRDQQIIQRRYIRPTSIRHPPLPRVLIIKLHLLHHSRIIPIGEDNQRQTRVHISFQFRQLLGEVFLLWIDNEQCAVLGGIETGERGTKHFNVITGISKILVHVSEIRVDVIAVPIEGVVFNFEVVTWEVTGGIAKIVVLVPKDSFVFWWCWYDFGPVTIEDFGLCGGVTLFLLGFT